MKIVLFCLIFEIDYWGILLRNNLFLTRVRRVVASYNRYIFVSKGLAYVDFCDDAHLASAVKKNKQILLGKQVSVLKSNPSEGRKKREQRGISSEHGKLELYTVSNCEFWMMLIFSAL